MQGISRFHSNLILITIQILKRLQIFYNSSSNISITILESNSTPEAINHFMSPFSRKVCGWVDWILYNHRNSFYVKYLVFWKMCVYMNESLEDKD